MKAEIRLSREEVERALGSAVEQKFAPRRVTARVDLPSYSSYLSQDAVIKVDLDPVFENVNAVIATVSLEGTQFTSEVPNMEAAREMERSLRAHGIGLTYRYAHDRIVDLTTDEEGDDD